MRVKIKVFCCDQRRVGQSKKTAALKSKVAGQIGELLVDDVVVSEFFLISVDVFDVNGHSDCFSYKKNAAVDQTFCCLGAHVGLVPFDVFVNIFVAQALYLFMC